MVKKESFTKSTELKESSNIRDDSHPGDKHNTIIGVSEKVRLNVYYR